MHMYARDLEDLSMLVTSRAKDAHVHICKDAQTGLRYSVLGSASSNISTATTVTYRAEKTSRVFHHMEHLLRQEHQHLHVQLPRTPRTTADRPHPVI